MKQFLQKFQHRNVAKVATAYAVVGWLMLQVIEIVLPTFNAPQWVAQVIIFTVIMGFPIALLIAWASEIKTKGLSENSIASASENAQLDGRSLNKSFWLFSSISVALVGLFAFYVSITLIKPSTTSATRPQASPDLPSAPVLNFELVLGETGARPNGSPTDISISPDGSMFVYSVRSNQEYGIYLRNLRDAEPDKEIVSFNGLLNSGYPQFSKDGQWVYYFRSGFIERIRIQGGSSQMVVENGALQRGLLADTSYLFYTTPDGNLVSNNLASGEERIIVEADETNYHTHPASIPNSNYILTTYGNFREYDASSIQIVNIETGTSEELIPVGHSPHFISSGYIIFTRDDAIWAQAFDPQTRRLDGNAVPILFDVFNSKISGYTSLSVAENGSIIFVDRLEGITAGGGYNDGIPTWVSRTGQREALDADVRIHGHPRISPLEDQALFRISDAEGQGDIWVYNFETNTLGRRTFGGGKLNGFWSLDGSRIIYNENALGVFSVSSNGTDSPTLEASLPQAYPISIDPRTNNLLVFVELRGDTLIMSQDEERLFTRLDLAPLESMAREARISNDGNFIAYSSNETGRSEIYVRPFPDIASGKWQVTRDGGNHPLWNPLNQELFFWNTENDNKYSINFELKGGAPSFDTPQLMFGPGYRNDQNGPWDYSPSRDQFLIMAFPQDDSGEAVLARQTDLNYILNWAQDLSGKVASQQ